MFSVGCLVTRLTIYDDIPYYIYTFKYMYDGVWIISGCIMVSIFMFSDMIFRVKGRRKMGRGFLLGFRGDEGVPLQLQFGSNNNLCRTQ